MEEEKLTVPNVDVDIQTVSRPFDDGSRIIPTRRSSRFVILLIVERNHQEDLLPRGDHFGAYLEEGPV